MRHLLPLLAFFAVLSCGGDESGGSGEDGAPHQNKGSGSRTPTPGNTEGRVVLLNPTLVPQKLDDLELDAGEVRLLNPGEAGYRAKAGTERVVCVGGTADFAQTQTGFGTSLAHSNGSEIDQEWTGVDELEFELGEYRFGLLDEQPQVIQVYHTQNYVQAKKLTWVPRDLPQKPADWTDTLRWGLLGTHRTHVDRHVRIQAQRTLPDVAEPRFVPLLLAVLLHTDPSISYDGGKPLQPALFRLISPAHRGDICSALETVREGGAPQPGHLGLIAVCLVLCGDIAGAMDLLPTDSADQTYFFRCMKGAPLAPTLPLVEALLSSVAETAKTEALEVLYTSTSIPGPAEIRRVSFLVEERPDTGRKLHTAWSNLIREHIGDLDDEVLTAMLNALLDTQHGNDRFPAQYVWNAGPARWPVLERVFSRLSETTQAAAIDAVYRDKKATPDQRAPLIRLAVRGPDRVAAKTIGWMVKNPQAVSRDLRRQALLRVQSPGTSSALKRKVEQAFGKR